MQQLALGQVGAIPDLLRQQAARLGRILQRLEQVGRLILAPRRQLIMGALAGQKRPGPGRAGNLEKSADQVLAKNDAKV